MVINPILEGQKVEEILNIFPLECWRFFTAMLKFCVQLPVLFRSGIRSWHGIRDRPDSLELCSYLSHSPGYRNDEVT